MNHDAEQEEIKPLIFNYIFHSILFGLIFSMHIIMYERIYWIFSSLAILFLLGSYLNILYFIFPTFPLIFICKKIYKVKLFNQIKKITLILLIISLTFGLIASIALLINSLNSKTFCRECPFNLKISHLNAVFGEYYGKTPNDDDIIDSCNSRRCVLDREEKDNKYPYIYLCNYNPIEEFDDDDLYKRTLENGTEISTNIQITCQTVTSSYNSIHFDNSELYSYLDLCYFLADFYVCKRFNKPKQYNLDLTLACPETNYLLLVFILCVLIAIIDIVISALPWGVEYFSLKRIVSILSTARRKANSNNSTARSSQISNDVESFKKEKTPVLIVTPNENNINENNNNENILNVLQLKNSSLKESKINLISSREEEQNKQKIVNIKLINSNSERKKLVNKNIEIDIRSNNEEIKEENHQRRIEITKKEDNTTIYSNQIKQLSIQINNKNDNK